MAVNIHAGQESAESCCRQVLEWTSERVGTSPISLQFLPLKSGGPMLAFLRRGPRGEEKCMSSRSPRETMCGVG
jgi:hypothetical protein